MEKFVLLPEKDEKDLYLLLPLIYSIQAKFPDAEINIVHTLDLANQLSWLKKKVSCYTVRESDFGPLASVKLAARLDDLFNISHVLCFREEVGSLHFAKALKAKVRMGWKSLVNDIFLTHPKVRPSNLSKMEKYSYLWEESLLGDKKYEVISGEQKFEMPENFFKEESAGPFIFFALDFENEPENLLVFISKIINDLKEFRVIVWSEKPSPYLDQFKEDYPEITDASEAKSENLHHYILRCRGFVSNLEWLNSQASYLLVKSFYIGPVNNERPYFKCRPSHIKFLDDKKALFSTPELTENMSYSEVVDQIFKEYSL
jgi:hypothetical protein